MVSYGIAKARAMANRADWNERTEITKAIITWVDSEYEYELEIENEYRMDDAEFFEETDIDDDALFDEAYEEACEFEWECMTGR